VSLIGRIRDKNFDRWLVGYGRHLARSASRSTHGLRHVLFAVTDHYEPLWNNDGDAVGEERVRAWQDRYPALGAFRDADGRPPQHSFFFPGEEYRPRFFDRLDVLCRGGFGEVELHLHHEDATAEQLRSEILSYLEIYGERGHLSRLDGKLRYAFIHGNWCLANSRPDGKYCGVDEELPLLFETGCYADFTFPSVPDVSQPNIVNQIYWPVGDLARRRAYEQGIEAKVGQKYDDRILMVTGPLAVTRRAGRLQGRIEYGALTAHDPPDAARVKSWVEQGIAVDGRPEWVFVKVYTHGAPEAQAEAYLGEGGRAMHEALTTTFNDGERYKLHYVTAREMFNIAMAAMDGCAGDPHAYRDYVLPPPPISPHARKERDDQGMMT
jgi:hypothetical protein